MKRAPMREVSKTLQIRWYRCPVDKKILRDLMMASDARGLFMSIGHLSLWLATGGVTFYLFSQQMWVGCLVALFFPRNSWFLLHCTTSRIVPSHSIQN